MFPSVRQRLIITTAALLGFLVWLNVQHSLMATDGGSGISLMTARTGPLLATALVALSGVPALVLAAIASSCGNLLAGVFSVTGALILLGWQRGRMSDYLFRPEGGYKPLVVEILIWTLGLVLSLMVIQKLRKPLRARIPAVLIEEQTEQDIHFALPRRDALLAMLLCAVVGALVGYFMLLRSEGSHVVMTLILSFVIGGFVAQVIVPQPNAGPLLLSPSLVALAVYAWVVLRYDTPVEILAASFSSDPATRLPGLALILPVHYVSAGVAGCAMGVGWARNIESSKRNASSEAVPSST